MHYTEISPEFTVKFFELVNAAKNVVITGHMFPDEDAFSSVLAIYEILQQKALIKTYACCLAPNPQQHLKRSKTLTR